MMTTMVSTSLNPMVPIPPIPPPPPAGSHTGGYSSINNGNGNGNDDGNSSRRGATTPSLKRRAAATATVTATAAVVSSTTATSNIHDPSTTRCTTTTTTSSSSTSTSSSTSSCCLDCRSLQSSLKRVRLSCSPGELRLQHDLLALPSMGWQTLEEGSRWYLSTPASTSRNGRSSSSSNNSNSGSGSSGSSHAPSHRRWEAELHVWDPLRLVLQVQLPCSTSTSGSAMTTNLPLPSPSPPRVGRIWIQIPRMYPHRPPVISRMEDVWMERMVIVDAPFLTGNAAAHESSMTTQTTPQSSLSLVVVYNQWSPVRTLGELLEFVLETATIEPSPAVLSLLLSSSSSSSRAVHSVRHNPSSPLSTLAPTASSSSSSPSSSPRSPKGAAAMMGPLHDATSSSTTSTNSDEDDESMSTNKEEAQNTTMATCIVCHEDAQHDEMHDCKDDDHGGDICSRHLICSDCFLGYAKEELSGGAFEGIRYLGGDSSSTLISSPGNLPCPMFLTGDCETASIPLTTLFRVFAFQRSGEAAKLYYSAIQRVIYQEVEQDRRLGEALNGANPTTGGSANETNIEAKIEVIRLRVQAALDMGAVVKCPQCHQPGIKNSGCIHIRCHLCATSWCYCCGRTRGSSADNQIQCRGCDAVGSFLERQPPDWNSFGIGSETPAHGALHEFHRRRQAYFVRHVKMSTAPYQWQAFRTANLMILRNVPTPQRHIEWAELDHPVVPPVFGTSQERHLLWGIQGLRPQVNSTTDGSAEDGDNNDHELTTIVPLTVVPFTGVHPTLLGLWLVFGFLCFSVSFISGRRDLGATGLFFLVLCLNISILQTLILNHSPLPPLQQVEGQAAQQVLNDLLSTILVSQMSIAVGIASLYSSRGDNSIWLIFLLFGTGVTIAKLLPRFFSENFLMQRPHRMNRSYNFWAGTGVLLYFLCVYFVYSEAERRFIFLIIGSVPTSFCWRAAAVPENNGADLQEGNQAEADDGMADLEEGVGQ